MNSRIYRLFFGCIFLFFFTISIPYTLNAETLRVPDDYGSIHLAVEDAQDGDIIEVAPGYYFETDIILNKDISLRSQIPYGAVIDGGGDRLKNLLIVRAEVEIEGFVLRNTGHAIIQRDSPDVAWTAHDLAIFDCKVSGISVNDREETIGSAYLYNLIIIGCESGVTTNEAGRLIVRNSFISGCGCAFSGSNHIQFQVDNILLWRNRDDFKEAFIPFLPNANSAVTAGGNIYHLDEIAVEDKYRMEDFLLNFRIDSEDNPDTFRYQTSMLLNTIGDIYAELDDGRNAAFWYEQALATARKLNIRGMIIEALYNLARVNEKTGHFRQALDFYRRAVGEMEAERTDLLLLDDRSRYMQSRMDIYQDMLNLLYSLHRNRSDPQLAEEAFNISEKSKARSFFDLLNRSRVLTDRKLPDQFRQKRIDLLKEVSRIQINLSSSNLQEEEQERLFQLLQFKEKQYRAVLLNIRKYLIQDQAILPAPYNFKFIQKNMPLKTAVLEYFSGDQYVFAFLATQKSLQFIKLPDNELIDRWIKNYREYLMMPATGEFKAGEGSKRLFNILVNPFGEAVFRNIQNLVIIPSGRMNYLPFETLGCPWGDNPGTACLMHRFQISYAGSASIFVDLSQKPSSGNKRLRLLGVANNATRRVVEKYPEVGYYRIAELPELKYCGREVKAISRILGRKNIRTLSGIDASEERFKSLPLSQFKILHFATHGVVYNRNWWRSALLLYPQEQSAEDGLLQPIDIFNLSLDNDLVVLSACRTGRGEFVQGEGILGFIQAFHSAGAGAVISSLWGINDRSTVTFMRHFYGFLTQGLPINHALTAAKKEMLDTRFSHPYYWAAFIAHGAALTPVFD